MTPLFIAITKDDLDICKILIDSQKTDVNAKSQKNGETALALFEAIKNYKYKIVELLFTRKDLDINIQIQENKNSYTTALLLAIDKREYKIVELLFTRKDLDINIQIQENKNSYTTALLLAIDKREYKIVELLLSRKDLNINMQIQEGENEYKTALIQAIRSHDYKIMKLLFSRKDLDVNAKVKNGNDEYQKALYLVINNLDEKCVTLFLDREELIDEFNKILIWLKYSNSFLGKASYGCCWKAKLISDGLLPQIYKDSNIHKILSGQNVIIYLGFQQVYHATTLKAAQSIMNENSLKIGTKGMFGAGIYFASKAKIAKKKVAHSNTKAEAYIKCDVDFGYSLVLHEPHHSITLKKLNELGCDSVLGRSCNEKKWEYVVYESSRAYPKSLKMFKE